MHWSPGAGEEGHERARKSSVWLSKQLSISAHSPLDARDGISDGAMMDKSTGDGRRRGVEVGLMRRKAGQRQGGRREPLIMTVFGQMRPSTVIRGRRAEPGEI
jgi:hypothetical protein